MEVLVSLESLINQELQAQTPSALEADLTHISVQLLARGEKLVTAESCTGGLIAAACTALAGSSQWFERGFVSYSNAAKSELLGVDPALIAQHGASAAGGARHGRRALAHSARRPAWQSRRGRPLGRQRRQAVGTVWFGWCLAGRTHSEVQHFPGDRAAARRHGGPRWRG
jgi:nicotinamide-nucleotide amidase